MFLPMYSFKYMTKFFVTVPWSILISRSFIHPKFLNTRSKSFLISPYFFYLLSFQIFLLLLHFIYSPYSSMDFSCSSSLKDFHEINICANSGKPLDERCLENKVSTPFSVPADCKVNLVGIRKFCEPPFHASDTLECQVHHHVLDHNNGYSPLAPCPAIFMHDIRLTWFAFP